MSYRALFRAEEPPQESWAELQERCRIIGLEVRSRRQTNEKEEA
jgi:hypothetical protein